MTASNNTDRAMTLTDQINNMSADAVAMEAAGVERMYTSVTEGLRTAQTLLSRGEPEAARMWVRGAGAYLYGKFDARFMAL